MLVQKGIETTERDLVLYGFKRYKDLFWTGNPKTICVVKLRRKKGKKSRIEAIDYYGKQPAMNGLIIGNGSSFDGMRSKKPTGGIGEHKARAISGMQRL